ncbi:MAG: hypothetical protein APR62_05235 [Smithella sp. SDB]|nr:MAG: hypothetical protein APR62_05235 [Smithella sp. SDB]
MADKKTTKTRNIDNTNVCITKRLYSIKESAVYLGRTPGAVREMLWAGKMPYVRDGKRILIDINDINEWIDKNKTRYE